jgi:hypothetical protein
VLKSQSLEGLYLRDIDTVAPLAPRSPLAFGTGTGLAQGAFERIIKGGADRHPAQEIAPCGLMLL